MPYRCQPRRTVAISVQTSAPPGDVNNPPGDQRIVDEKPTAPVESGYISGLATRFAVSRRMAPIMIVVKGAGDVYEQAGAPDGPGRPRYHIPPPPSARKQIDRGANSVSGERQPDRYFCEKFAIAHPAQCLRFALFRGRQNDIPEPHLAVIALQHDRSRRPFRAVQRPASNPRYLLL